MMRFVSCDHPTGAIFNGDLFRAIPRETREYYFTHSDAYPETYLRRDLLLKGKGAQIISGVFIYPSHIIDFSKVKSTFEQDNKKQCDLFYAPHRRTLQFFELIDMVQLDIPDRFTESELNRYFKKQFDVVLGRVSLGWRNSCGSSEMQAHYGQKVRNVGISEMLGNIKTCCRDTKSHLIGKGTYSPAKQRIMYLCLAKAALRIFLDISGLYKLLRLIKHLIVRR